MSRSAEEWVAAGEAGGAERDRLTSRILGSVFWAAASSGGNQLIRFGLFVVLTRRVAPAEFGLVALSSLIVDFLGALSTNGLASAVIRKPELSEREADTAFWTSLALGAALFVPAVLLAPLAAIAFHDAALAPVLQALALTLLIAPLGAIHTARLERELKFRTLAARSLVGSLAGGAAGLALSFSGWTVWALVARALVTSAVVALMVWPITRWRPRLRFDWATCRSLLRFSSQIIAGQLIGLINGRAVELAAGLLINPAAAGLLRMGARCLRLLTQVTLGPLSQIALPVLSTARGDPQALQRAYVQLSRVTGIVVFPVFLGLMAVSDIAFPLVFGPRWQLSGLVLPTLCLIILPSLFNLLMTSALVACDRAATMVRWNLVQAAIGLPMAVAGAALGLAPLIALTVARGYVVIPLGLRWLKRDTGVSARAAISGLGRPLAAAALMAIAVFLAKAPLRARLSEPLLLAVLVALGAMVYAGLVLALAPDLSADVRQLLAARRARRAGREGRAAAGA